MLCDEAYAAATVLRQHYFLGASWDESDKSQSQRFKEHLSGCLPSHETLTGS